MESNIQIKALTRKSGKTATRKLKTSALVPAIIYGPKTKNINVYIEQNDAIKYTSYGFENAIFTLNSEDKSFKNLRALVKSVERHPFTQLPIHIDFYSPDMKQSVRVNVELRYEGTAAGTAEDGLVSYTRKEVEIECLPTEIPEFITVDESSLELNHSLHISDIVAPAGVTIVTAPELAIASCAMVQEEPETPTEETEEGAEATTPTENASANGETPK